MYMSVYELNEDELNQLKEDYIIRLLNEEENRCPSWGELLDSHDIDNKVIYEEYGHISFVKEDFWCNV